MRNRGFTLIEMVVVVAAVALLFGVALDRLLRYQELGERASVEMNVSAINTALTMKFAAYVAAGRPQAIEAELSKNPMELLVRPPENYLGELFSPDIKSLERRSWYFDRYSRELLYLPGRSRYLTSSSGPPEVLRFHMTLVGAETRADGIKELMQPFVVPAQPFTWNID
jgi:prepilin-type N-terminal cleavage/methylation domain-containing protein